VQLAPIGRASSPTIQEVGQYNPKRTFEAVDKSRHRDRHTWSMVPGLIVNDVLKRFAVNCEQWRPEMDRQGGAQSGEIA
jgi:hypothetical protein